MEVSKQASKHGSVRRFYSAYCFTVDGVLVPVRESSDFQLVRSGRGLVKVPITPSGHPSSQLTQFLEFRDVPEWAGASFGQGATVPTYLPTYRTIVADASRGISRVGFKYYADDTNKSSCLTRQANRQIHRGSPRQQCTFYPTTFSRISST